MILNFAMGLQPRGDTTTGWWVAGTAMTMVTIATIVANSAMMVALWRVRRAPSHYPLISLVFADLMVGLMVQPLAAARELFVFNLNRIICACWGTLDVLCCTASILSLCALGWERWSGITAPLARARRARRARLLAVMVWPVATMVALPSAFIPSPKHFHPGEMEKACSVNINTGYVFFSITFSFYIPATMLVTMYGYILRALSAPPPIRAHRGRTPSPRRHLSSVNPTVNCASSNPEDANNNQNQNLPIFMHRKYQTCEAWALNSGLQLPTTTENISLKGPKLNVPTTSMACTASTTEKCSHYEGFIDRQRRATRTIVMLMALFLICWTPYFVILPLDSLFDCIWETTWQWCTWLGYINSALNPLVYAAASPSVRRALHPSLTSSGTRQVDIPLTVRRG